MRMSYVLYQEGFERPDFPRNPVVLNSVEQLDKMLTLHLLTRNPKITLGEAADLIDKPMRSIEDGTSQGFKMQVGPGNMMFECFACDEEGLRL